MIPVQGYANQKVAVLGLGRSGLATARALLAGGAEPLLWDDSPEGRAKAEAEGFICTDLTRQNAFEGAALLVTSPGIPHLYPKPHPIIAAAMAAGVPVDNDIGLFFRSYATAAWDQFTTPPPRRLCDRFQRQIHHHRPDKPHPVRGRPPHPDGRQHRARCP